MPEQLNDSGLKITLIFSMSLSLDEIEGTMEEVMPSKLAAFNTRFQEPNTTSTYVSSPNYVTYSPLVQWSPRT
jgi:hypothetical protein